MKRRPVIRTCKGLLVAFLLALPVTGSVLLCVHLDWFVPTPSRSAETFIFRDGFEDAHSLADLFPHDLSRWHGWQWVPGKNTISLDSSNSRSGSQSLKCFAHAKRDGITSKADVLREQLHFVKGDHVWSEAWFFLEGGADAGNLFLWDLESSAKWQSPGRRIYLEEGDRLASDLGKWFNSEVFRQPPESAVRFPTDRWVRLRVHLVLSESSEGLMEVWQDDAKVIEAHGQTLPTGKTVYDRLEVGITANGSTTQEHTLHVDDVIISNQSP